MPRGQAQDGASPEAAGAGSIGLRGRRVVLVGLCGGNLVGLRAAMAVAGATVADVASVSGARRLVANFGPRAVVVVDLPRGVELDRLGLSALGGQDAVLLLASSSTSAAERVALLGAGADHVLTSDDPDEVLACVSAVLRRGRGPQAMRGDGVLRVGDLCVDLDTRAAATGGLGLALTGLEFDLLAYLMSRAGHALTRERLLADVWGFEVGGLDTVTVHVRRLRMKIEKDPSRPVLLTTVWGVGYRLETGSGVCAATSASLGALTVVLDPASDPASPAVIPPWTCWSTAASS